MQEKLTQNLFSQVRRFIHKELKTLKFRNSTRKTLFRSANG